MMSIKMYSLCQLYNSPHTYIINPPVSVTSFHDAQRSRVSYWLRSNQFFFLLQFEVAFFAVFSAFYHHSFFISFLFQDSKV